jgi:aryl-alcohol dehydrogenase-like predicted oxidoreductase
MQRYNMAHRKGAAEVFPWALRAQTPILAFTATRWGTLLEGHTEWPHNPPTAADCYRYCLAEEAVRCVLTAPRSLDQLDANVSVLTARVMNPEIRRRWERFGDILYHDGSSRGQNYETRWP